MHPSSPRPFQRYQVRGRGTHGPGDLNVGKISALGKATSFADLATTPVQLERKFKDILIADLALLVPRQRHIRFPYFFNIFLFF